MQQEIMIKMLINKIFCRRSNISKIANHSLIVKLLRFNGYRGFYAMSVQVAASTGVIHQPVTVTEIDFFSNCVHFDKTTWFR